MIDILTGDFRDADIEDNSVDLVLTDPPYAKEYLPLWSDLSRMAICALKPGGFLVTYSGQMYLPEVMRRLGEHLEYYWLAGLQHIGPKTRIWPRKMLNGMKPILIYAKRPVQKQHKTLVDLIDSRTQSKRFHAWGQKVSPVRCLLEAFTIEGDLVWDPFLGGGTTAAACLQAHRNCIGHEIDPEVADVARERMTQVQPMLMSVQPAEQLTLMEVPNG